MFEMLKPMIAATLLKAATAMQTKADILTHYAAEHLQSEGLERSFDNYMLRAGLWADAATMILESLPK